VWFWLIRLRHKFCSGGTTAVFEQEKKWKKFVGKDVEERRRKLFGNCGLKRWLLLGAFVCSILI
jgi:hypothetical protein